MFDITEKNSFVFGTSQNDNTTVSILPLLIPRIDHAHIISHFDPANGIQTLFH